MRLISFITTFTLLLTYTLSFSQEEEKVLEYKNEKTHKTVQLKEQSYFKKKPKNIIFLIGDGMGVSQVYAGLTANGGELNITNMPVTGFSQTHSATDYVTDSAAGGTALATGQRTYNDAIAVDLDTVPIPTILEISNKNGLSTGLVATSSITHATPASFIAHQPSRSMDEEIAADFLESDIDVFIGGGYQFFANRSTDDRNLVAELEKKEFKVFKNLDEAQNVNNGKLAILTADEHNPAYPERGEMLPEATEKAINILKDNKKGFFLMVEGSMIDWGGHGNDTKFIVLETLDFDKAVAKALEFASSNKETLVVVTADHETGGMSIENGSFEEGVVKANYTTGDHTAVMVPVFAYGAGAQNFTGVYKNVDVFNKMMEAFGFKK